MKKRKLFIDTDAGTDDAIALIMAMRDTSIDIAGISTSGGNVPLDHVVQNVLYVRELCNNASPVYRGANQPLSRILGTADFIHGKDGLGDIGLDLTGRICDDGLGSEQLINAILAEPGEVELVCLGPLTNIALAARKHPGILDQAKRIYVMGGIVQLPGNVTPLSEYNIWADPEAADEVLSAPSNITMIGWDTTLCSSNLTLDEVSDIRAIGTSFATFSMDIQGVRIKWMEETGEEMAVNLADVLAMAVVLDDSLVTSRGGYSMKVRGGPDEAVDRGYIEATPVQSDTAIDYVHTVDRGRFLDRLTESLS